MNDAIRGGGCSVASADSVDLDDTSTWPADLAELIANLAHSIPKTELQRLDSASDLHNVAPELAQYDAQVREILAGRLLLTYHATRLLDYETEDVWTRGLLALTEDSLNERVDRAVEAGFIAAADLAALKESTALVHEPAHVVKHRFGEVSLVNSRQPLAQAWPLGYLSTWGGEVRQFGPVWTDDEFQRVRRIGLPSLIIAGIDVSTPAAAGVGRELVFDFIGIRLGLSGNGVTVHHAADIPADQILDVCRPGHPEYDRHAHFPRS
ncbi:hypothetical protein ABT024_05015 [Streptomyces sp. NPDC002812]|uniref:hypothetical protein n=1 Tax=Streptomyces sp. NPDC002812 TaxID=3154434 RepID=UPI00332D1858